MCGLTGFLAPALPIDAEEAASLARNMAKTMERRGPDGEGIWLDWPSGLVLAHRRLSVVELSAAGAQPMISHHERYVIVFNGEIYNHPELRIELELTNGTARWRGSSDTEVLLAAIETWGVEASLQKIHGMFAFALWDRSANELTLARDRMGEKPLYYGYHAGGFVFGSELKPICAFSDEKLSIDQRAIANFLKYGYVPAPMSIYQGIQKLPPASFVVLKTPDDKIVPKRYWSIEETAMAGSANPYTGNQAQICDHIDVILSHAVKSQLMSDVPLGVFLSGGIDSSLITALMVKSSTETVKSFSIGFEDSHFNESKFASEIASYLKTDHHNFVVTEDDALKCIPTIPMAFDEPFADSSQIPTQILSAMTSNYVTAALSGDGGDEIFGGYNRYLFGPNLWKFSEYMPSAVKKLMGNFSTQIQSQLISNSGLVPKVVDLLNLPKTSAFRFSKFGNAIAHADDFYQFFENIISIWPDYTDLTSGYDLSPNKDFLKIAPKLSYAERMMIFDSLTYMPDDILVKVDRSAMFNSLETRAPFLDPSVISAAWSVPLNMKIQKNSGKKILKDILSRYIPSHMFERPKQGFSIPIDTWLRGDLKEWAGDHLTQRNLDIYPLIDSAKVLSTFDGHIAGRSNFGNQLWPILMLMSWTQTYR